MTSPNIIVSWPLSGRANSGRPFILFPEEGEAKEIAIIAKPTRLIQKKFACALKALQQQFGGESTKTCIARFDIIVLVEFDCFPALRCLGLALFGVGRRSFWLSIRF